MHKIALLDLGGVVFSSTDALSEREISALDQLNEKYSNTLDLGSAEFATFLSEYNGLINKTLSPDEFFDAIYAGRTFNDELIQYLNERFTVYVASNNYRANIEYLTKRFGPDSWSAGQFYSYQMGVAKPNPEFFMHILDSIGVKAAECVFIDDNEENVRSAYRLGITSIRFETTRQAIADLKTYSNESYR